MRNKAKRSKRLLYKLIMYKWNGLLTMKLVSKGES